jgi:DNA-binding PadR family transcriptional regulator
MILLLRELSTSGQQRRHGYDLMKTTGLLSGTLYPLLMRMTEQGLVEAQWLEPTQSGRPARHAYRLTTKGAATAREALMPQPAWRARMLPA